MAPHDPPPAHADGFRIDEERDDAGRLVLAVAVVAGDAVVASSGVVAVADDIAGRAELSRVRALADALASYLNYGGDPGVVAGLVDVFAALPAVALPPGVAHVTTRVDARRIHVLSRAASGDFLLVDEGVETRVLSPEAAARYCDECAEGGDDDDWSFLAAMREEIDADAIDDAG